MTMWMNIIGTAAFGVSIAAANDVGGGGTTSTTTGSTTGSTGLHHNSTGSDTDKLFQALSEITSKFQNVETILQTFGLSTLPIAQRYGILFGCMTFIITIAAVLLLLVLGGTFTRIAKEANKDHDDRLIDVTSSAPSDIRQQRSLLYEELLEQRQRMMLLRYSNDSTKQDGGGAGSGSSVTEFTKMLCNVAPSTSNHRLLPAQQSGYEENYRLAYRQCQDRPGGSIISGHPEARYEAYARGYASCGHGSCNNNNQTIDMTTTNAGDYPIILDTSYRRSYGRMVESITCENHTTVEYYHNDIFVHRPNDIIGAYIRLEPLTNDAHGNEIYHATCTGESTMECLKAYNPYDVWCFHDDGPFQTIDEVRQSKYLFPLQNPHQHPYPTQRNTAAFAIRQNVTNHFVGIIFLLNDEPEHLSVQLQIPFMAPKYQPSTSKECMEGYFLIIDRLFAYGYRRIYMMIDTQDIQSMQFIHRMGFTHEGCLYKHRIVKDANRNSNIYAILNSDWKQSNITASTAAKGSQISFSGARAAMFQKLYGAAKFRADQTNERYEAEQEQQTLGLLEQKQQQEQLEASKVDAHSKKKK